MYLYRVLLLARSRGRHFNAKLTVTSFTSPESHIQKVNSHFILVQTFQCFDKKKKKKNWRVRSTFALKLDSKGQH